MKNEYDLPFDNAAPDICATTGKEDPACKPDQMGERLDKGEEEELLISYRRSPTDLHEPRGNAFVGRGDSESLTMGEVRLMSYSNQLAIRMRGGS